jgi:uncharacterized protein with von Willebrand factor type A (vWA) domain
VGFPRPQGAPAVSAGGYRYGRWAGGPDPLAPPYDVAGALDALGERVLAGVDAREALRDLLASGTEGRRGLAELRRSVRRRQREARSRGRLDGALEQVRELLARAVESERSALFPDPGDAARMAELELDTLPDDPARAVRALADYDWRSPEARTDYEAIRDLLRREVLDTRFRGLRATLAGASPEETAAALDRVKDMLADLNAMLDADARGEHTPEQFAEFLQRHGEFFPDAPQDLDELVESLARRAAAAERLMRSLTPQQRHELSDLMATAAADLDLASELDRLGRALRSARPDLPWRGRERMTGDDPLSAGDAVDALEELADLDELDDALAQDSPGASLDDIDLEALERELGRPAVDDVQALRRLERELHEQGYLRTDGERLELTPRAVRRLGATALRRVFSRLSAAGRGGHDVTDAGAAGERTGATRQWRFGDEQPLDAVRTVHNAVLRTGPGPLRLAVEDFEVVETERRTSAAVSLLVDLSFSMTLRGHWPTAKSTALALQSLVTTRYPQDAVQIVGFSDYARELSPTDLAGLSLDYVQGTNLQHGLMLANRFLARHPDAEPVVLLVTDGEPTAHLERDGSARFDYPPLPRTLELTLAEVERATRRGATINVFMLEDEPRLVSFVEALARRNGGRVFRPSADRLGEYVVADYLRARRGRRAG